MIKSIANTDGEIPHNGQQRLAGPISFFGMLKIRILDIITLVKVKSKS